MPDSRAKHRSAFRRRRKRTLRYILLALLAAAAILSIAVFGRYLTRRKADPGFRFVDFFRSTAASEQSGLSTGPADSTADSSRAIPSSDVSAAAIPTTEESREGVSEEESREGVSEEESSGETKVSETAAPETESKAPDETAAESVPVTEGSTEEETAESPEETAESTAEPPSTAPQYSYNDPLDIRYHLCRSGLSEADIEGCRQLVAVKSDAPQCMLYFFEKNEQGWHSAEAVPVSAGVLGRGGIIDPTEKHEGDNCTPAGLYRLGPCYGEAEASITAMEYHQIREGDFWVDDSNSRYYNRYYSSSEHAGGDRDFNGAESLHDMLNYYGLMVLIQYNYEDPVPYAGSAIFLHLQDGFQDTSGCISTNDATMFAIFLWLLPKADPHILIY